MNKTIFLGITSGIAAFKTIDLIKLLQPENIDIHIIMTDKAKHMVSVAELEKLTGNPVHSELFDEDFDYKEILQDGRVEHIALADKADLMVIVPATANIIAKLAHGISDDFLTTTVLAMTKPIILCPAMNVHMWKNPIVKQNIEKLKANNFQIVEPVSGMLACGYEGPGRLEDIKIIKQEVITRLHQSARLKGKKIIVTSGGTKEKIDEVRFITNRSSGKMGAALAEAAYLQGAEVFLVRAKNSHEPRYPIKEITYETNTELLTILKNHVPDYNVIFHAAAVSDFRAVAQSNTKLSSAEVHSIQLEPQSKIIEQIKSWNPRIKLIGFKATVGKTKDEMITIARKKLESSHADAIIANDSKAFENNKNEVYILEDKKEAQHLPVDSKLKIAENILKILLTS